METVILPAIRDEAVSLVRRHQAAGEQVVIVTATNEFVTGPIARAFGVRRTDCRRTRARARRLDHRRDRRRALDARRQGRARVAQWLAARGLGWSDVEATFYSDSINDLPLLETVDHPVATNPDERLRVIAGERGWRILDLFRKK